MIDPRVTRLAELLCTHSCKLSSDDAVLIHAFDMPEEAIAEVARVAQSKGARVAVRMESNLVRRQLLLGVTESSVKMMADIERFEMKQMTAYIALRGMDNSTEHADVPQENQKLW